MNYRMIEKVKINGYWFELCGFDRKSVFVCHDGLADWGYMRFSKYDVDGIKNEFRIKKE